VYRSLYSVIRRLLSTRGLELVRLKSSDPEEYLESGSEATNRVEDAETMIGARQLDNLQFCITDVLRRDVPGDLLEAGVWRGGASIFMRAVLKAYGDDTRRVWLADSFAGLPRLDPATDTFEWKPGDMAVSLEQVRENFARYGLLDEQVRFLRGFFADTLPDAPIERLSILRVDADLFASTRDVLYHLYPRLSVGGYAVFDDYQNLPDCRRAIDSYREEHNITEPICRIDRRAVYWRKERCS
jgi:O-methyltransferase